MNGTGDSGIALTIRFFSDKREEQRIKEEEIGTIEIITRDTGLSVPFRVLRKDDAITIAVGRNNIPLHLSVVEIIKLQQECDLKAQISVWAEDLRAVLEALKIFFLTQQPK